MVRGGTGTISLSALPFFGAVFYCCGVGGDVVDGKCSVCGKVCSNRNKVEFIRQWGATEKGSVLYECMVGTGVTEILINKGIARYKKSANKKNSKSVSAVRKSKRSKRSPKG